ncbi:type I-E CRISPR-associated protein Cas6/Cse3/CasE [Alcaligenes sp. SDU_A2]|uniref:type I-E CRISPR-associated protein Cas6/Cse3/CasE n=1 Tax=Alcaligenes sp. SDU_A2 TaxID=3136634 RepID=UPI00311F70EF
MYLSKISLAPGGAGQLIAQTLSRNGAYAEHQVLWQLFTDQAARTFIFRQEMSPGGMQFYVLSEQAPAAHPAFVVRSKAFRPRLAVGQKLAFSLRANPTVCSDHKRHDVLMHAKQRSRQQGLNPEQCQAAMEQAAQDWLGQDRRAREWGFSLDMPAAVDGYMQHQSRKKKGTIRFSSVDYQGVLTIQNPDLFWQQYCLGYGRAKALGCGLMLLRPV